MIKAKFNDVTITFIISCNESYQYHTHACSRTHKSAMHTYVYTHTQHNVSQFAQAGVSNLHIQLTDHAH